MLTQEEWVQSCLSKYRWEPLPANQKWEAAHFPLPECLGGEDTILLWSADHVVQGLLQSVEYGHRCFHHKANKTDTFHLTSYYPQYLKLFKRLKSEFAKRNRQLSSGNVTGYSNRSVEKMTADGKKGGKITGRANVELKRGAFAPGMAAKGGAAVASKLNSQKWQCLVTGHICNAGALSTYQKARGIDHKNKELRTRRADLEG